MNQSNALEFEQSSQDLVCNWTDELQWHWLELVLLQVVVEVLLEHLKHKACVIVVPEVLVCPDEVELMGILMTQAHENAHLDLPLTNIRRVILQDLDRYILVGILFPASDYLTECALAQEVQYLISSGCRIEQLMWDELVVAIVRSVCIL